MAATRRQRWRPQLRPLQRKFIFWGKHSPTNKFRWRFSELLPILCDYEKDITYYDGEPSDGLRQQF